MEDRYLLIPVRDVEALIPTMEKLIDDGKHDEQELIKSLMEENWLLKSFFMKYKQISLSESDIEEKAKEYANI